MLSLRRCTLLSCLLLVVCMLQVCSGGKTTDQLKRRLVTVNGVASLQPPVARPNPNWVPPVNGAGGYVPAGFRKPLIVSGGPVGPEKTEYLSSLAKIVAKEPPAAATPIAGEDGSAADDYNGEDESAGTRNVRMQPSLQAELSQLQKLIATSQDIAKLIPEKQKRAADLQKALGQASADVTKAGGAQLAEQQKILLSQIVQQENDLQNKLNQLKSAQTALSKAVPGGAGAGAATANPPAGGAAPAAAPAAPAAEEEEEEEEEE